MCFNTCSYIRRVVGEDVESEVGGTQCIDRSCGMNIAVGSFLSVTADPEDVSKPSNKPLLVCFPQHEQVKS